MSSEYVVKMENISKEFSGNRVLKDVSLRVRPGEIHALMGENGAGKSTLMNILFGMPAIWNTGGYDGTIEIDGEKVKIDSPQNAMECGIGMVHQEFMLIPGFTATENIKLGREVTTPTVASSILGKSLEVLDRRTMARDARRAMDTIGLGIDENTMVGGLPVGYMQFIEIAREIDKTGMKLLIFDEPTAVLTESEAERLLRTMKVISDAWALWWVKVLVIAVVVLILLGVFYLLFIRPSKRRRRHSPYSGSRRSGYRGRRR